MRRTPLLGQLFPVARSVTNSGHKARNGCAAVGLYALLTGVHSLGAARLDTHRLRASLKKQETRWKCFGYPGISSPNEQDLANLFDEVKKARWSNATDVKRSYATASIVSADRIVFNIKGNDYRLVVATGFDKGIVWIKWIGTHKDYDKIDVREVQHGG